MFTATGVGRDEPEPEIFKRPVWLGPPEDELGRAVDVAQVLARSDRGLVALSHAIAYSTGVSFTFEARVAGLKSIEMHMIQTHQHVGRIEGGLDELPDGFIRIGLELPGGARVSNLGMPRWRPGEEPDGPSLVMSGGGGGQTSARIVQLHPGYWLHPLPDEGTIRVSCEWPIAEIPFTTVELAAAPLRAAGAQAIAL